MIVVVGAGIAGLSLAHQLVQRGADVTIVEAKTIASGASGVATSYLEPRLGKTAMRLIEQESMKRWPQYAGELETVSSINVGFRSEGQIKVSLPEKAHRLEKDLQARTDLAEPFTQLSPKALLDMEPALSPNITLAAHMPHVRWVNGRQVCRALSIAIKRAGGRVLVNHPITAIGRERDGWRLACGNGEDLPAKQIVICTGIGVPTIDGLPSDLPQSRPVRGVNLVLDQSSLRKPLSHMIKHHRGNLCPREGGELIVGTTYEAGESSLDPSPDVIEFLYQNAEPILPAIRQLPLVKVTAGLRSKVGDGMLRLGRSTENPQLFYSLSHGGSGYLRAPVISQEFANFVLEGKPGHLTEPNTQF